MTIHRATFSETTWFEKKQQSLEKQAEQHSVRHGIKSKTKTHLGNKLTPNSQLLVVARRTRVGTGSEELTSMMGSSVALALVCTRGWIAACLIRRGGSVIVSCKSTSVNCLWSVLVGGRLRACRQGSVLCVSTGQRGFQADEIVVSRHVYVHSISFTHTVD